MLFGLIVIPLSLVDLKEQATIQTILGLLRVLLIVLVLVFCVVKLTLGDDSYELQETPISKNNSNHSNSSESCSFVKNCTAGQTLGLQDIVVRFDWKGWLEAIPVLTISLMIHHSIPSFVHPIKQKQYLWWYILCAWGFLGFCFLCIGVIVPLWFRGEVQETLTLNWVSHIIPSLWAPHLPSHFFISNSCLQKFTVHRSVTSVQKKGHDKFAQWKYTVEWSIRTVTGG